MLQLESGILFIYYQPGHELPITSHQLPCRPSQQGVNSHKYLGREAHGEFELVVAFKDVRMAFPAAESFPIDESF